MSEQHDDLELRAIVSRAERNAERIIEPVSALGMAIVNAAIHCRDFVSPVIRKTDNYAPSEQEAYVFYEYLYLFIDLAMRDAVGALPFETLIEVRNVVARFVSSIAIGTYFSHWAAELKQRITSQFIEKLNERSKEFTETIQQSDQEFAVLDHFAMVAYEVVSLAEQIEEWEHMKEPMLVIMTNEWMQANFTNHLADVYAAYIG